MTEQSIYDFMDSISGKQDFWTMFDNDNVMDALVNMTDDDSICPLCKKSMNFEEQTKENTDDFCDNHICYVYRLAYKEFSRIIRNNIDNDKTPIFLNMCMVEHNINFRGDYTHPYISGDEMQYNKEMIIMLKKPYEKLDMKLIKNKFMLVKKTLLEMRNYHFDRRSFYFEYIPKKTGLKRDYKKLLSKDSRETDDSHEISLIEMTKKFTMLFDGRDEYAELSSLAYFDAIMNSRPCVVYEVGWGS